MYVHCTYNYDIMYMHYFRATLILHAAIILPPASFRDLYSSIWLEQLGQSLNRLIIVVIHSMVIRTYTVYSINMHTRAHSPPWIKLTVSNICIRVCLLYNFRPLVMQLVS